MIKNNVKKIIKGKWWNIENKLKETIYAHYDPIKDWKIDKKGYFLINIDRKKKLIRAGYCKFNKNNIKKNNRLVLEIVGKSAIEVVNTIIKKKLISSLQHAADMGIELHKAEIALKTKVEYVQDQEVRLSVKK